MADDRVEDGHSATRDSALAGRSSKARPGPATTCASRKWSADPLQQHANRAAARFPRALCRTRTGDPFITMALPPSQPTLSRRTNALLARALRCARQAVPTGTFRHPRYPLGTRVPGMAGQKGQGIFRPDRDALLTGSARRSPRRPKRLGIARQASAPTARSAVSTPRDRGASEAANPGCVNSRTQKRGRESFTCSSI